MSNFYSSMQDGVNFVSEVNFIFTTKVAACIGNMILYIIFDMIFMSKFCNNTPTHPFQT